MSVLCDANPGHSPLSLYCSSVLLSRLVFFLLLLPATRFCLLHSEADSHVSWHGFLSVNSVQNLLSFWKGGMHFELLDLWMLFIPTLGMLLFWYWNRTQVDLLLCYHSSQRLCLFCLFVCFLSAV